MQPTRLRHLVHANAHLHRDTATSRRVAQSHVSDATPTNQLSMRAAPIAAAISAAVAATSCFEAWPQSSSTRLDQPRVLVGAHRMVISLLSGRAA